MWYNIIFRRLGLKAANTAQHITIVFFDRNSRERVMTTATEMKIFGKVSIKIARSFSTARKGYSFCWERFRKALNGSSGEPSRNRGQNTT